VKRTTTAPTLALLLWSAFVLAFAALSYGSRAAEGKPDANLLYKWSTFESFLVQYAFIALIIWGIASLGQRRELFAARRPASWGRAAAIAAAVIVAMAILTAVLDPLLHPGQEQGYTPKHWESSHASQYVANALAIAVVAPIVEELTFRGLGFSLLRRFGDWPAIVAVGVLFGAAHGLVRALPLLVALGIGLAYLRSRVDSVYPGIVVHGLFNGAALVLSVVS
jgi:membrane protease YdiL (CAAX protease family)